MKYILLFAVVFAAWVSNAQKETTLHADLNKVTVFFKGGQLEHSKKQRLLPGKQVVVFDKLTDFLDPNTIQVKATGSLTILAVSLRKNYEDKRISNEELRKLNEQLDKVKMQDKNLRDEHYILQTDKNLLSVNSHLKGNDRGVVVSELKEAYTFIHARMVDIAKRETEIESQLEDLNKEMNRIAQEIDAQRSKPVVNYSEIMVEIDCAEETDAEFFFSYISPNASWQPYYDMRSNGVGMPISLEAKAFVNQNTGIEWKDVSLVLSTNDPYQNSQEVEIQPWYLSYNSYPPYYGSNERTLPAFDYSGQKIRGEVIDGSTGQSMPFAKVYFSGQPTMNVVTNFEGKFEITVPKGERYLNANYVGYQAMQQYVNAPYIKFLMNPNALVMEEVPLPPTDFETTTMVTGSASYSYAPAMVDNVAAYNLDAETLEEVQIVSDTKSGRKKGKTKYKEEDKDEKEQTEYANAIQAVTVQKDLRVEYEIQSKFSLASDGIDQRVSIASYELPSSYEYHTVPKIDPNVYLVAQVSGWEKLNLLSGESNIYFDGTFIGKSFIDVNSTKDTLSFSMGKDSKVQILRTKITEKSKSKAIGSRQKFEAAWEIKVKNNGAAEIPLKIKDQFPISVNDDIKVKRGSYSPGKLDEKTGIITWESTVGKNQSVTFNFDYLVDYKAGMLIYLE